MTTHSLLLTVCDVFGVTKADLLGRGRTQELSDARQCFYWVARRHTRLSNAAMAQATNRCKSNAVGAVRRAQSLLDTSRPYRELVNTVLHRHGLPLYVLE